MITLHKDDMTKNKQTTSHLLMIRPAAFGFNAETARSNAFQTEDDSLSDYQVRQQAIVEFDEFVHALEKEGVDVSVIQDSSFPDKPDAVFPNNWVSFHENGVAITYPMLSELRRLERREEIFYEIGKKFIIEKRIRMEDWEDEGKILEGTGSLVLDRPNKLAYACLSPRTDRELVLEFCRMTGYKEVIFHASDPDGVPIYHTNVLMAMGDRFVVICMQAVKEIDEKLELIQRFQETEKEIVEISMEQLNAFAGNMLQVENGEGESLIILSEQAFRSLRPDQVLQLEKFGKLVHSSLFTIEKFGGGSARCMMAEIFLPTR